jgi:hypothetical protein
MQDGLKDKYDAKRMKLPQLISKWTLAPYERENVIDLTRIIIINSAK